ncbi:Uncharacterised protein [Mycobacteroides abscessus subsp. abscessus]|nr:Uncharacterised protein [Mycobacteroides abscessus subsp. abscessus]
MTEHLIGGGGVIPSCPGGQLAGGISAREGYPVHGAIADRVGDEFVIGVIMRDDHGLPGEERADIRGAAPHPHSRPVQPICRM